MFHWLVSNDGPIASFVEQLQNLLRVPWIRESCGRCGAEVSLASFYPFLRSTLHAN